MRPFLWWCMWIISALPGGASAETVAPDASAWAAEMTTRYYTVPNVAYSDVDPKTRLDVHVPRNVGKDERVPAVVYIHGGGWMGGDKAASTLQLLPYMELGWVAVNVDYRGGPGTAPAAVQDSRSALRWVVRNAPKYHIDENRIVVTGESAGGHLALASGMLPPSDLIDGASPGELKVAAIVNWYGIADVIAAFEGENQREFAVNWLSGVAEAREVARSVSPLRNVRNGLPPILSVYGDADPIVPYEQAVRLHEALDSASVPNRLVTISGGGHGGFSADDVVRAHATIREFLKTNGVAK